MMQNAEDKIYEKLCKVHNATIFNLSAFTHRHAKDLNGSLQQPTKAIYRLIKQDRIKEIKLYPEARQYKWNTFYAPKELKYRDIAKRETEHNSGIRDILLGLVYNFPDYSPKVVYEPIFRLTNGNKYKPDAHIRLSGINGDIRDYILEFERTRAISEINKEKIIKKCEKLDFAANGLLKKAKFLFVYTHETYNVFVRPIQYNDISVIINKVNKQVKDLARSTKNLNSAHQYLFLPFHDFHRIHENVLHDSKGRRIKLINR